MKVFKQALPRFVIAAWVMTAVVVAIGYGLCLGTVAAFGPPDHNPTHRT